MHLSYPANRIKNLMITVEAMCHEIERKEATLITNKVADRKYSIKK